MSKRTMALAAILIQVAGAAVSQEAPTDMDSVTYPSETTSTEEELTSINLGPLPNAPDVDTAAASTTRSRLIEEIVVTAQKREENLRDVPISIAAFSAEKLEAAGIESAQDLGAVTPGLIFTESVGYTVVFLRGVGTDAFLPSADPSVPIYVDGISLANGQGIQSSLGHIQRVEILKGPQGTLFGRNALGGAINIVTEDPNSEAFSGDVKLGLGSYNRKEMSAYLNIPLAESLALSLNAFLSDQDSFYAYENDVSEIDVYSRGGRAKLVWNATDNLAFTLTGAYSKARDAGSLVGENTRPSQLLGAIIPRDPSLDRHVTHNTTGGSGSESYLIGGKAAWGMSSFDTNFIVSYQSFDVLFARLDFDNSALPIASFDGGNETPGVEQFAEQFTAELQFLSNSDTPGSDWLEWVGGVYYLRNDAGLNPVIFQVGRDALAATPLIGFSDALNNLTTGLGLAPFTDGVTLLTKGILETESLSAYAQGTIKFTDSINLTLGGRIDTETRNLADGLLGVRGPTGEDRTLRNFEVPEVKTDRFAPRVAVNWAASDLVNIYASYSVGYLSPTYNTANFFSVPDLVEQEKSVAYELGLKGIFLDGAAQVEAALFHTELSDIITGFFGLTAGGVVRFANAGDGEIDGAELNLQWQPMPQLAPGLGIVASATYLDAVYTRYPDGRGFDESNGLAFGPSGGISPLPARDFTGNRIINTPEYTYTLGINQLFAMDSGELEFGLDTYFNDGYFFQPQNSDLAAQRRYQLYNARVSYLYAPWDVKVAAFVHNLTDEDYLLVSAFQDFGRIQTLAAPRTYGLSMIWRF